MFAANRRKDVANIYFIADWLFITPAVVIQLITGLLLAYKLGYSLIKLDIACIGTLFLYNLRLDAGSLDANQNV